MNRIVIFGATSAIAEEVAVQLAGSSGSGGGRAARSEPARVPEGGEVRFALVGRDPEKLAHVVARLAGHPVGVHSRAADLSDPARHPELIAWAVEALGGRIDLAFLAHGTLPDQERCESEPLEAVRAFETNTLSHVSLLLGIANVFERQAKAAAAPPSAGPPAAAPSIDPPSAGASTAAPHPPTPGGTIAVISSVAGDLGRRSNYVYGATKGGLDRFLEGLRARLHPVGVRVLTIKPGFVRTPMTRDLGKLPLAVDASKAGALIVRGMRRGREVMYVPWFWRWILLVLRSLPRAVQKRLNV